jgi:hypothetical protein
VAGPSELSDHRVGAGEHLDALDGDSPGNTPAAGWGRTYLDVYTSVMTSGV